MCGRYGFSVKDAAEVRTRFDLINTLDELNQLKSRYNIAPGQINPVVIQTSEGNKMGRFFWGLIPSWSKDDSIKFKTINARIEGIENKPVYRKPFRTRRCLVPATFFYEWDKSEKPSRPYLFKLKDNSVFSFAGLYDIWSDKQGGKDIYSYTIITTQANKTVSSVHNRMPVILKKEDEKEWLNPDISEPEKLLQLLQSYPDNLMEEYPVSPAVNSPTSDSAEIAKPLL